MENNFSILRRIGFISSSFYDIKNHEFIRLFFVLVLIAQSGVIFAQTSFLDLSFGTSGSSTMTINSGEYVKDIKLQSDGKIVAFGSTSTDNGSTFKFCISRLNTNGSPDNSFGTNGYVVTALGSNSDIGRRIVIQSDSKIIACGSSDAGGNFQFGAVRYNTNGSIDMSFGTGGKVLTSVIGDSRCSSIVLQSDGKFILGGASNASSMAGEFAMVRYNSNGTIDSGFGVSGTVTTDVSTGYFDGIENMVLQPDGKIVVVGRYLTPKTSNTFRTSIAILRYNTNGTIDNTFGVNGKQLISPSDFSYPSSVKIQPDGKIVVHATADSLCTIIRLNTNGNYDTSFGSGGVSSTKLIGSVGFASFYLPGEVVIHPSGKLLVVGTEYSLTQTNAPSIITCFNPNGTIDTGFGVNGIITTGCPRLGIESFVPLAIQSDGKLVTGSATDDYPLPCSNYIERYLPGSLSLGVSNYEGVNSNEVFPNPARSSMSLHLSQAITNATYCIYNCQGEVADNGTLNHLKQINIESLPSGTYLLKIEGISRLIKFIKE